jgi:hypothetical protein
MTNLQAVIIALGLTLGGVALVTAQQVGPASINGCVYYATPPTLTNGQSYVFTCDVNGKLRTTTTF